MDKFELSYAEHFLETKNPKQIPLPGSLSFATPHQASLNEITDLGNEMIKKKSIRIFKVFRSFGDAPSMQLLPFGIRFCAVMNSMQTNPYILGIIPCVQLAPKIQLQKELIQQHQLQMDNHLHPSFEIAVDQYIAHYKMITMTKKYKSLEKSWEKGLSKGQMDYERFITKILGMTRSFEIYSMTLINDVSKTSHENLSRNYLLFDHHIQEIMSAAVENKEAHILAVVGKWEANRFQQVNLNLFFFVERKASDIIPFEETKIFQCLNQFIDRTGLIHTLWTPLPELLTPIFYNVNQINFGKRLQILKAYLIGTDHYIRIFDKKSSFEVFFQAELPFAFSENEEDEE